MRTFAAVKRRIQPGTVLRCVQNTYRPELDGTLREVTRVQGNGFWWKWDRDAHESWTEYAPASAVTIVDADTFRMGLRGMAAFVELRFE